MTRRETTPEVVCPEGSGDRIRRAVKADADAIATIWNAIIRDTALTFTNAEKAPGALADAIVETPFFVANGATGIQGFATYGQFRNGPGYAHTMEHSVHVAETERGQGLGRDLLLACEDDARARDVHSMFAGVAGENPGGVLFHAAMGYTQVARLPRVGRKFGRWHDLILMQKFL